MMFWAVLITRRRAFPSWTAHEPKPVCDVFRQDVFHRSSTEVYKNLPSKNKAVSGLIDLFCLTMFYH